MSYGHPEWDAWPSVRDDSREIAAQRAAWHGALCLQVLRWALEFHHDIWLDQVFTEARDAFSWAGEAVADCYCSECQAPREYYGDGKYWRCGCQG